jgi:hypothetical protein
MLFKKNKAGEKKKEKKKAVLNRYKKKIIRSAVFQLIGG